MSLVRLSGVVREIGTLVILDHVDAAVALGDRVGLVGPNGAGKTTLLRIVAGLDEADVGVVQRKRGLTIGLLSQETHLDATFTAAPDLRRAVRAGAAELERLETELAELEAAGRVTEPRYGELQHRFDVLDGYTLDLRVEAALSGLGFERDQWDRPPSGLSGGEQTRAALGRLVIAAPDLLLLDEPTNHLDLNALEWLEEVLRRRAGAFVVASHDRAFLDATVGRIWELRDRRLTVFRGDYSAYHRQREERDALAAKEAETTADRIARERALVQRYRSHRDYAKMHEHERRLAALQPVAAPRQARRLRLPGRAVSGGEAVRSADLVVRADGLVVGYAPRLEAPDATVGSTGASAGNGLSDGPGASAEPVVVARAPFLELRRGERVGIVGPNGVGKTTLLRTIAGELPPLDGSLLLGSKVQLGYLAQLRRAALPGTTVLEAILDTLPLTSGEARSHLARFLFRGDDVDKEVRSLSGGERSRLELALLGLLPSNLLLLDEPTNHLDIPAREAIEAFLRETGASLLVVSHDRRLLETICESLWVVDGGLVAPFEGGYREWRVAVADGWAVTAAVGAQAHRLRPSEGALAATRRQGLRAGDGTVPTTARHDGTRSSGTSSPAPGSGPRRRPEKLSKDAYRRRKTVVEADLTRLGLRKSHLELALADPAVGANFVELRRITSELADVEQALAAAEEAWLELEEAAP
ncbi:MAG TPA: ABC-F family ATP-binding cassette domain-containing protein [Candidatus Limnocylindrales bacterium]